ncbi:intracellular short-chain-length polyhydroxyalkanoate depolymerase [Kurthia massiliensis]|uniref:intracellular short-chain-length polyhydroxyalkanoate depolymerase n=1 Tax=Kurthia massiliensis TaxID=1033739 RepID=UPI000287CF45|nr:alpha/beta hydrolase [Kurthia massiliensis]
MGLETVEKVTLENGETLAYRKRDGDGTSKQTILLIHGNTSSSIYWDTLMEALDPKYTIYAVDLRGFGDSSYECPAERIEDYSHDVEEWLEILDLKHVIVVGWSMGGAVAMDMCIDNVGERIEKCVLISSASTRGYPFFLQSHQRVAETIEEIQHDIVTKSFEAMQMMNNFIGVQAVLDQTMYTHNKPDSHRYGQYIRAVMQQRNLGEVYYALHTFNIVDEIDDIQVPVLVVYGDRDYVVSKEMTEEIITDFGGRAQVLKLKDCGHAPMVDQLPLLTEGIEKFIE